ANNFFALPGSKPPQLNDNNDGGNVGGYILKNKLFFFGNYEGDYLKGSNSGTASFPTQTQLSGNESGSPTLIYDPNTGNPDGSGRTPFPGNVIDPSRINPISAKIAALVPATNLPGVQNNVYLNLPSKYYLHKVDTKYDWNPNSKLH